MAGERPDPVGTRAAGGPHLSAEAAARAFHISDGAAAVTHALGLAGGTFNVSAEPVTRGEWLESLGRATGRTVTAPPRAIRETLPRVVPMSRGLAQSIRLDPTALTSTGWSPEHADATAVWAAATDPTG